MRTVIWSPRARREFEDHLDWLAERNPQAAERVGEEIVDWMVRLAAHPDIGHPTPRWPGFLKHSLPARSKFVLYEVSDDAIRIAAFRDGRQDNTNLQIAPSE